ncbi:hypothetical protein QYF36_026140 [Acer negundo]|nr:hypothetical protein QYF36_026140 [Acer negundo]
MNKYCCGFKLSELGKVEAGKIDKRCMAVAVAVAPPIRRGGIKLKEPSCLMSQSCYSSGSHLECKVVILGVAGVIGQPLSLLMKLNPLVSSPPFYDISNTPGVAADVNHINS